MKKLFLVSAILFSATSMAQTSNAEDRAQARPDSTVKADVVTETQITQALVLDGNVITESTQTIVQPSVEALNIEAPATSLPAAAIIDDSKDLEATMKLMGRNFKAINGADNIAAMAEPAAQLSQWASQAEALSIGANAQDQEKFLQGIQQIRKLIADLEIAIENKDEVTVRTIINGLGDVRKEYHKYFDMN